MYEDPLKTEIDLSWLFCSRKLPRELIGDSEEAAWDESVMCSSVCLSMIDCSMCTSCVYVNMKMKQ
jgi:DX module.